MSIEYEPYTIARRIKDLNEAAECCLQRAAYLIEIRNRMQKLIDNGMAPTTEIRKIQGIEMW